MTNWNDINRLTHNRIWNNISNLASVSQSQSCKLRLLQYNVRSLLPKVHHYQSLDLSKFCDVISANETWLKPTFPDQTVQHPGFNIVRCDRDHITKSRAGGVAVYIRDKLKFTIISNLTELLSDLCESVWISIHPQQSTTKHLIVASIYLPPDSNKTEFISRHTTILSH